MKAAIYYGPYNLKVEDIKLHEVGDLGAIVKIRASGICGSDLHPYKQKWERYSTGIVIGHEYAGDVVEVGSKVKDVKVGDRVFAKAMLPCFECDFCKKEDYMHCRSAKSGGVWGLHGGFAEYIWLPIAMLDKTVFRLANTMSYQDGALVEPIGVGTYVVNRAEPAHSDTVIVLGAGIIGLGAIAKFKDLGVSKLMTSDISEKRLKAARELGADILIDATKEDVIKRVMQETSGKGADIVVEAAGKPATFLQAIDMVRPDGKMAVVATYEESFDFNPSLARPGMPMTSLVRKGVRLIGCLGGDWAGGFDLIKRGKVKDKQVVSHVFPLDKIVAAFEMQMNARESIKVMIEP
ncbi:MAG: alcohol dehydrogenase catalytic domain-containing protein [Dehalococcoidales bacterium]|nr:alcohol dehydrogenase catalytic domain-containing protein [Dehalococcoidales bacterium]